MSIYYALLPIMIILLVVVSNLIDAISFRYKTSILSGYKPLFWNPKQSWGNKYKKGREDLGSKFFLSSSVLSFLMDGQSLLGRLKSLLELSILLIVTQVSFTYLLVIVIISLLLRSIVNFRVYNYLSRYNRRKD